MKDEKKPGESTAVRKSVDAMTSMLKPSSGYYTAGGITGKVDGDVLYAVWDGLAELYEPELSLNKLKKYLKIRKLPDPEGRELVNTKRSCHEGLEAVIFVKGLSLARSRPTWENNTWYKVQLNNLTADDSPEEKLKTLRNIKISCSCDGHIWHGICRPPAYQRRLFGDYRSAKDNPSPFIDSTIHGHSSIAFNYAAVRLGTYDMGIFGYTPHALGIGKKFIKGVLDHNVELPDYRINRAYGDLQYDLFKPVIDQIKNGVRIA